jgi:phospholipid/cholesterol/gamma-HCH transport system substrate-binding protein
MNAQRPYIDSTFSNLAGFTRQMEAANIDQTVDQLRKTLSSTSTLLDSINAGKGSMGKLMTDEELYNTLNAVSNNLNRLLIDFRHHPDRYVSFSAVNFGRKVVVSEGAYGVGGIVYEVQINESKKPLDFGTTILNGKYQVYEDYRNSKYVYTLGQTTNFDEASEILDEVKEKYDESVIVALENGVPISIKKARRMTD